MSRLLVVRRPPDPDDLAELLDEIFDLNRPARGCVCVVGGDRSGGMNTAGLRGMSRKCFGAHIHRAFSHSKKTTDRSAGIGL